eukprot:TRINITY_DN14729_c0_g1_i1.p1 TRINITY_DN14729_c0_g1~~TRINITY_DN14729_c0_g1_i1.p1  ORF type:complete len:461 (+),score=162.86 TRINITY_DN14729_c0_g1_i1:67-1449(+)
MRGPITGVVALLASSFGAATATGDIAETYVGTEPISTMVASFNEWIDEHGGEEWSAVVVAETPGMRLGAVARRNIKAGSLYLAMPWKMVLSEEWIAGDSDGVGSRLAEMKRRGSLTLQQLLMAFLLFERYRPSDDPSFWKPYIDLLPGSFNTPVFWTERELNELRGTGVDDEVRQYKAQAREDFRSFKKALEKEDLLEDPLREHLNFGTYLWASMVADSRTIWIDGRHRVFLPMLDMVNCRDHPTKKHLTRRGQGGSTNTFAIWDVAEGEQLFENYATTNRQNLVYHGFVLDENSHDTYQDFSLPQPPRDAIPTLRKLQLRPRHHLSGREVPQDVVVQARVQVTADPEGYKGSFERPLPGDDEAEARKLITGELRRRLRGFYGGSSADDGHLLQTGDLSPNVRTAVQYRQSQKKILESTLRLVKKRMRGKKKEPSAGKKSKTKVQAGNYEYAGHGHGGEL